MNLQEVLAELESLGSERLRQQNIKHGAKGEQFGVKMGDIRKLAKTIKSNHELALELWASQNIDARFLAILLLKPKALSKEELESMMMQADSFMAMADWFINYIIKKHAAKEELRQAWLKSDDKMLGRAAWSLTAERIVKKQEGLDIEAILNRLEAEMGTAAPETQWTMNFALAEAGIHFPEHREKAMSIGEQLGLYRDYPVSKGCTSPFAPIWIQAMVDRQK